MKHGLLAVCLCLGAITDLSCKEPLPGYNDPVDVFDAYAYGLYAISLQENAVKAYITIVNTYDETFDGTAILSGQLVITWAKDVSFKRTVQLTASHLIYARNYNAGTGVLRLDPGDSIRFGFTWDMVADDGRRLFSMMSFFPDPECPARFLSAEPIRLSFEGTAHVYHRTRIAIAQPGQIEFVLHREFVRCRPAVLSPSPRD
ncbi:MAG: hypothetical protein KF749_15920 [Bacteroidetes bacterium]|nr:hypothetical protein [Bacteroidota bacterium]MCW5896367.1 hypothetical protein [Bacteroidota bacterium]